MFHCLVIKVVCLHLSADSSFIISLAFCFVKNFFILFFKFFFHLHQQLWYNIMSSVSCQHFFYIFFNFIQPNLCCLSKKIRLTQKRIYHIIIFFLRQVLFYIFLHIFYTISDIAIISSFLTPQYQSKEWTSHDWSHMLPDALGVRLNIGGYACNLGLHNYALFPCRIRQVSTLQVVRCISACIYAAFKSSISEWSFLRSA